MKIGLIAAAAAAAFVVALPVEAATIVVDLEVSNQGTYAIDPVTLGVGDTLDITIRGVNGAPVSVGRVLNYVSGITGAIGFYQVASTWAFTGLSSNSTVPATGSRNLAPPDGISSFASGGVEVYSPSSFTTFRQQIQVIAGPTRTFDTAFFAAVPGAVPEPSTWALMVAGFGAVAGALRRRTSLPVKAAA